MKNLILFTFLLAWLQVFPQNQPPVITNLSASFSYSDNKLTVRFGLADPESDSVEVFLNLSDNSGKDYLVDVSGATGDIGFPVIPGMNKKITWDAPAPMSNIFLRVKVVADDRKPSDIQSIVDQIDSLRLRNDLLWIEGIRHPIAGLAHLEAVKDSLEIRFMNAGLHTYRLGTTIGAYNMENVIGLKAGGTDMTETYILDGHFDGVSNSPAADDNGSAVAGVLEAMRVLAPHHFKKSIRFIGFDQEEAPGAPGSQFYVSQGIEPYETIKGVLNFEMIGYYDNSPNSQTFPSGFSLLFPTVFNAVVADSSRGNFLISVSEPNSDPLKFGFEAGAAKYVPELRLISFTTPQPLITPDLLRSDHARFWEAGIPALMLTDGADFRNPNYHMPGDTLGTLNFTFMHRVVKAAVGTIAELAGIIHGDVKVSEVGVMNTGLDGLLAECGMILSQDENHISLNMTDPACFDQKSRFSIINLEGKILKRVNILPAPRQINISTGDLARGFI